MFFRAKYHLVLWSFLFFIPALVFLIPLPAWAAFTDSGNTLTGVWISSVAWGDYDNDGDLDILLTGKATSGLVSKIYRNNGGTFTEDTSSTLTGVYYSSAAWGDYDNDGDLDIILTGWDPSFNPVSIIYRNDGGTFTEDTSSSLTDMWRGSVAWGDYDNDGDLDILLTGSDGSVIVSKIYRNDGGIFTEDTSSSLTGVLESSVAWGDYDNDGDLDILLTGTAPSLDPVSKIYRNDGGIFAEDTSSSLTSVRNGSVAWGDYDNDGDLDILLTGRATSGLVSKIYRNDGGIFTEDTSSTLTGVEASSVAWGDYDNDGDLDILLTGYDGSSYVSKIYRNNGGTFAEDISSTLTNVYESAVAWGDYDNDGDLDILLTGRDASSNLVSKIYRNDGGSTNTLPTAPTLSASVIYGQKAILLWDGATDAQTPTAGLTYNIRVGTTSGGVDTVSPMADASGYRMIPALGRAGHRNSAILDNIDPTKEYYFSVQAVDTAFEGSAWSTEMSFSAAKILTVVTAGSGSGTVTSSPAGIDCGVDCSEPFAEGDSVTLTATADTGSSFTGWAGGGCSGTGTCTVTMDESKSVTAVFDSIVPYTLTVISNGSGSGTVTSSPAGIDCGATCSEIFTPATTVTLTATADPGSVFTGWAGGGCSGTGTCTVTMDASKAMAATFDSIMPYTLTVVTAGSGSGTVASSPAGIDCGVDCSEDLASASTITLTATADTGSVFTGWAGGGCSGTGDCTVTMDAAKAVAAVFDSIGPYTLTVISNGSGSGVVTSNPAGIDCGVDCSEVLASASTITLTAIADTGSTFTGWSGAGCSGTGDCTVTMDGAKAVAAAFETPGTTTTTMVVGGSSGGGGGGGCFVNTAFSDWRLW